MSLISILEAGRRDFLEATRNISPEQASGKPTPKSWSVLECIEHVAVVEDRFLGWISNGTAVTPERSDEKAIRLFTMVTNRTSKFEAPEVVHPRGRFETLAAALAEFEAVRDRSVQMVRERGDSLYSIGTTHPRFGNMNAAELIHLIDGHARRHADQIRETCEALAQASRR
jgi:hypothetical protein